MLPQNIWTVVYIYTLLDTVSRQNKETSKSVKSMFKKKILKNQ